MIEVGVFAGIVGHGGVIFARRVFEQRRSAVAIGCAEAVQLRQHDGVDEIEALFFSCFEIARCLFPVEAMEQLPRGITDEVEALAIFRDDVSAVTHYRYLIGYSRYLLHFVRYIYYSAPAFL